MTDFANLGLSLETLKAVAETGYTQATPIQAQAIPVALTGRDVLGIAQTGTGKTAAFTLPMIDRLAQGRARARMPRSLVLCPTRELADQVAASFEKYAKHHKLAWALLIGGVSMEDQIRKLDRGVDVLIATPGRLLDLFDRSKILLTGVQMMVVDEADRMLDMGFIPDIERIFKLTPPGRQTLFFSATMPPEITRLTTQFLKDPTRIEASRPATTAEGIFQYVARIPSSEPKAKRMALRALIERAKVETGIVFCNRKTDVDIVAKSLKTHGFDAAPIHGDLDQSTRTRTLESFRAGTLTLLVASDVAARGLDIPAVGQVFNFDVPFHADDYVHRIGRTGRAGRTGEAYMIVTPNDARNYDKVLKLTKKEPEEVVLDLDWSLAEGGERREKRRPERRDRDRHDGRDRPVKDHGQRASMEPAQASERPERPERPAAAVEQAAAPAERPRRERGRRGEPREGAPARAEPREAQPRQTESREAQPRQSEPREPQPRRDEPREAEPREPASEAVPERSGRRERRPRRDERPAAAPAPAPVQAEPPRRSRDGQSDRARGGVRAPAHEDRGERGERSVVGFGSDMPAFLRALPPRKPEAASDPDQD